MEEGFRTQIFMKSLWRKRVAYTKHEVQVFQNSYVSFNNYLDELKEYDKEMSTDYDLGYDNRRGDSFRYQLITRLKLKKPLA